MWLLLFPAIKSLLDSVEKDLAMRARAKRLSKVQDGRGAIYPIDLYVPADPEERQELLEATMPYAKVGKQVWHGG